MNKQNYVIGYSGHAYVVVDVLLSNGISLSGYCEKEEKKINPYRLEYLGDESNLEVMEKLACGNIYLGIGQYSIREKLYKKFSLANISMPYAVHVSSIVSKYSHISDATLIMPGVIVNSQAFIGCGVICNSASIIEHECTIGDFCHIAPGAVLAGGVTIDSNTFIGANAVIREGIKIGKNVIVGAGSVIVKDISDNNKVVGNPQKIIT